MLMTISPLAIITVSVFAKEDEKGGNYILKVSAEPVTVAIEELSFVFITVFIQFDAYNQLVKTMKKHALANDLARIIEYTQKSCPILLDYKRFAKGNFLDCPAHPYLNFPFFCSDLKTFAFSHCCF